MKLRIGVDFDNTLISYEELFRDLAARRGWVPRTFPASKEAVKAHLLEEDGNDLRWQRLQAEAYGEHILKAKEHPGFRAWLVKTLKAGHEVYIVSHKSRASNLDPSVRLRERARQWLKAKRLMSNGHAAPLRLKPSHVIFAATRDEKVAAIARLRLDAFVDDLRPVLEHPAFPSRTAALHFHPKTDWGVIARRLDAVAEIGPDAASAIMRIFGRAPASLRTVAGGNNRLFRVALEEGGEVLVKRYLLDPRDARDRAGAEYRALQLMEQARLSCVPKAFYKDPRGAFTVMSVLPGRPMKGLGSRAQVLQAARFAARLTRLPKRGLPEAADSRKSLADYPRHIERRFSRIVAGLSQPHIPDAARLFVKLTLVPLKERLLASFRHDAAILGLDLETPLPPKLRVPSPSDFGFHNAVLSLKGKVQFLDFEYFGLDDPAKLAADFQWHLGQKLAPELRELFARELAKALSDDKGFRVRLELVRPLVGLEWALIALNVLAPEQLARRRFSNPDSGIRSLILRRLAVAMRLIRRLE